MLKNCFYKNRFCLYKAGIRYLFIILRTLSR